MDPTPFVNTAGQVLSTAIQSETAKRNTDATNAANQQLMDTANAWNLDQWNRMNDYNTPDAQAERWADAGLSKALMYGQGTSGNATTLPKYEAIKKDFNYKAKADPGLALQKFQDVTMRQSQIDNVRAQTEATNVKTGIDHIMTDVAKVNLERQGFDLGKQKGLYPGQLSIQQSQNQQEIQKITNLKNQGKISAKDFEIKIQELRMKTKEAENYEKYGVTRQDNILYRQMIELYQRGKSYFKTGKKYEDYRIDPWKNDN